MNNPELLLANNSQLLEHDYNGHRLQIEIQVTADWPPNISIISDKPSEDILNLLTNPLPMEEQMDELQSRISLIKSRAKIKSVGNTGTPEDPKYQLYIISENGQELQPFIDFVIIPLVELQILPLEVLDKQLQSTTIVV
jgi:hypothetical protein